MPVDDAPGHRFEESECGIVSKYFDKSATRTLEKVRTEMSLHVLAYNLKRVIAVLGAETLMEAMRA
jgi:hypothetical protein